MLKEISNFDEYWFRVINNWVRQPLAARIFFALALWGIVIYLLLLIYYWYHPGNAQNRLYHKRAMVMAALAVLLATVLENLADLIIARPRPYVIYDGVISFDVLVDTASFPSLHVAVAFAFATMLWLMRYRKSATVATILALAIGLARVATGVHYPTDILAGIVLGALSAWVVYREASWLRQYLPSDKSK